MGAAVSRSAWLDDGLEGIPPLEIRLNGGLNGRSGGAWRSQDDIASKVREKFGEDVDPAVTAVRAVADVSREPLQRPVTPEQEEALKKRMAEEAAKRGGSE